MNKKSFVTGLVLALFFTPLAFAQNDRSWVSSTGNDSNACTRSAPCATFTGALANTNANGEIDVVDPGDYGTVKISKSVTIDGGGMGRIVTNDPNLAAAVWVNNVSGVILRNFSITSHNSRIGILAIGGTIIENVQISGFGDGLDAIAGSVVLRNSTITNCSGAGAFASGGTTLTVDGSLLTGNGTAIEVQPPTVAGTPLPPPYPIVLLSNSTITGNTVGLKNNGFDFSQDGSKIISFVNNRIFGNGSSDNPNQSVYQK
jgi:hypothetical protein